MIAARISSSSIRSSAAASSAVNRATSVPSPMLVSSDPSRRVPPPPPVHVPVILPRPCDSLRRPRHEAQHVGTLGLKGSRARPLRVGVFAVLAAVISAGCGGGDAWGDYCDAWSDDALGAEEAYDDWARSMRTDPEGDPDAAAAFLAAAEPVADLAPPPLDEDWAAMIAILGDGTVTPEEDLRLPVLLLDIAAENREHCA